MTTLERYQCPCGKSFAVNATQTLCRECGQPMDREICVGRDPTCPCVDGLACHYVDLPGLPAMPIPEEPES